MPDSVPTAAEALARLRQGNERFVADLRSLDALVSHTRKAELAAQAQRPIAIVLGCSDSRVPAEIVFDQGLGDLFVIRVAGNIVAPSQVGSIEFAASRFGTRLVVVLGHSNCGAVLATLEVLEGGGAAETHGLRSIVERLNPVVEPLLRARPHADRSQLVRDAVRANVRASANRLHHGSALLERLIALEGLAIVGGEYCLETGRVDFFHLPDGLES
jgi:carbonic anhydrase